MISRASAVQLIPKECGTRVKIGDKPPGSPEFRRRQGECQLALSVGTCLPVEVIGVTADAAVLFA
jgi:hypothetical protein